MTSLALYFASLICWRRSRSTAINACNVQIIISAAALALADPGQKGNSAIRYTAQYGLSVLLKRTATTFTRLPTWHDQQGSFER